MTNKIDPIEPNEVQRLIDVVDVTKGSGDPLANFYANETLQQHAYQIAKSYIQVSQEFEDVKTESSRLILNQRGEINAIKKELEAKENEIQRCYKMNCGRDYMHLQLSEAVHEVRKEDWESLKAKDKQIEELKAMDNLLRDFMESLTRESTGLSGFHLNGDIATWDEVGLVEFLQGTPQQSLKDHDDALIERCATLGEGDFIRGDILAERIRKIKGDDNG